MEDFPGGSDGKVSAYNAGDLGSIPGSGRFPWRRKWQPTPVLLPGKSHGRRSLVQATVHGVVKSRARLSDLKKNSIKLEAKEFISFTKKNIVKNTYCWNDYLIHIFSSFHIIEYLFEKIRKLIHLCFISLYHLCPNIFCYFWCNFHFDSVFIYLFFPFFFPDFCHCTIYLPL